MFSTHIRNKHLSLAVLALLISFSTLCQSETPNVVASTKPLHSLISHITNGTGETELLLDKQQSPHHFQLRPSQKRMLNRADIFFYSSDNLESFVEHLKENNQDLEYIELSQVAGIQALTARSFHNHSHHDHFSDNDSGKKNIDGHIWLSINNARIIAQHVSEILTRLSPENASSYANNLQSLLTKLDTLQDQNFQLLNQIKEKPFLVYHDAYQYFEVENKLTGAHFVTTTPEHTPGIKRIKLLRQLIQSENIHCVFYEPPNIPGLIVTLTENSNIKVEPIDPAGSQIQAGKQHYFTLMQQTASILYTCLSDS